MYFSGKGHNVQQWSSTTMIYQIHVYVVNLDVCTYNLIYTSLNCNFVWIFVYSYWHSPPSVTFSDWYTRETILTCCLDSSCPSVRSCSNSPWRLSTWFNKSLFSLDNFSDRQLSSNFSDLRVSSSELVLSSRVSVLFNSFFWVVNSSCEHL